MLWFFVVIPLIVKECERTSNGLRLRVFDEQVMLKHRDAEIVEITYLNQGVDLRGFLRQRKFIVRESVVLCDAVNRNKGTVVMLNDQMCQVNCFVFFIIKWTLIKLIFNQHNLKMKRPKDPNQNRQRQPSPFWTPLLMRLPPCHSVSIYTLNLNHNSKKKNPC